MCFFININNINNIIELLVCLTSINLTTKAQNASEAEQEISKPSALIESERKELGKEACHDCSYIT